MALLDLQALEVADYCDHDGRFGHDDHCGSGLSLLLCGN
ncbi:MAG: SapB/AmfS family lanthipeptide [Pseudonocardiales bacterium]|nr:SapB/AmfS family lanthipeptide [Pseudonocardiales bacterium]MBV9649991.1 SapB/AmfS family lanthipeptide [Pseudonocardiales bacterium]